MRARNPTYTLPPAIDPFTTTAMQKLMLPPLPRPLRGIALVGLVSLATLVNNAQTSKAIRRVIRARLKLVF